LGGSASIHYIIKHSPEAEQGRSICVQFGVESEHRNVIVLYVRLREERSFTLEMYAKEKPSGYPEGFLVHRP